MWEGDLAGCALNVMFADAQQHTVNGQGQAEERLATEVLNKTKRTCSLSDS